jgi:hypothetical protein
MLPAVLLASLAPVSALSPPQDTDEFADGSFIEIEAVSDVQSRNLYVLGKVWGFLKYHHPRVTAGELDWDAELFRVMPDLLDAESTAAAQEVLATWALDIGEPKPCQPCAERVEGAHLEPELGWLADDALLGARLGATLRRVHEARPRIEEQHYVALVPNVQNPQFRNEKDYAKAPTDAGLRLLALFRYWNTIAYWFPYRDVIGEDWDGVLAEFIPRMVGALTETAYQLEMLALIVRVNDTHANLWNALDVRPPTGPARLPITVRFVEGRALVTACAESASGLQMGDVLLALDGRTVEECVASWGPYYAASNEPTRYRDLARQLTCGREGPVRVRVERDGRELEVEARRATGLPYGGGARDLPGETFRLLTPEVAYLKLSGVRAADVADQIRAAEGTLGLIVDIRNYPSEFVVFALGQHLVAEPTLFTRFTHGVIESPGTFVWTEALSLVPAAPHYAGRVVILVDETSQSQAEYTTMAFRVAKDALVIGSTTAGADGNVSPIVLPGGLSTMISGIGVFYPDRTPTQRVGIVPDLEVLPTIDGVRAGRDEVLEAALRAVLGPKRPEPEIRAIASDALGGKG